MLNFKLKEVHIFVPFLIAYFILCLALPFITIQTAVKFLLFQFLFLLLPGYIFSKYLLPIELTNIQRFILGYPLSLVVIFILSWISRLLGIKYIEAAILLLTITAIYQMAKQAKSQKYDIGTTSIAIGIAFYSICVAIAFRLFILPSALPTPAHPGLFYLDSLWTVGNTWIYSRGFPLNDARFAGVPFGYHMLQNVFQATVFKFTRIEPLYIHFYLEPLFDWFIRIFLIFYAGLKILKLSLRQTVIFSIGLFFSSSFLFSEGFQAEQFYSPLSFSFGLPVFILFIFCIYSYLSAQKKPAILYLVALFIYFTATKAILGVIIPVVLIILFILKLVKEKKFFLKDLLLVIGLFLGALLIKFTILKDTIHGLYYDYDVSKSLVYAMLKKMYFIKDYTDLIYPFYRFFSNFFRYFIKAIFNWPVLLFFLLFLTSRGFRIKIREKKDLCILIFVFWLITLAVGSLFMYPSAIVYYYWYPQAALLILGVFALDYILSVKNLNYKIAAVLFLALGIAAQVNQLNSWIKAGYGRLLSDNGRIWDKRASVDYGEWQAMEWLKKNTNPNTVFFTDRRFFTHQTRKVDCAGFGFYSALSGRRAFAEGDGVPPPPPGKFSSIINQRWDMVNQFLSADDPIKQRNLLNNIPADYFIQSLRFNNKDFSGINGFKLVYENNSVKIFKILR